MGGSLGLFLGWSCQSIVMSFIDVLSNRWRRGKKPKKMSNPVMVLSTDNLGKGKNYTSQDGWSGDALPKVNSD